MYYAHSGAKAKALDAIARARDLAPTDLETIRREALVNEVVEERSHGPWPLCANTASGWAAWKRSRRSPTWPRCAATLLIMRCSAGRR